MFELTVGRCIPTNDIRDTMLEFSLIAKNYETNQHVTFYIESNGNRSATERMIQ